MPTPAAPAVRLTGIRKQFGDTVANDGVDFVAARGEVHALLGENGAGKSTLCNVLTGLYRPDAGTVEIDGRHLDLATPRDAIDAGIGMVHQEFRLVPTFSVAENVALGHPSTPFVIHPDALATTVRDAAGDFGLDVDVDAKVWQLSIGEQQRVEILRVLVRGATILVLDEPTAVLTPAESDALFVALRAMVAAGRTVVFISHKLDEVMRVADRVTVLRDGRNVATLAVADTDVRELARTMVGRDVLFERVSRPSRPSPGSEPAALLVADVSAADDRDAPALRGVSLTVGNGEIVGVAGVAGNGQRELAEVITGARSASAGHVEVDGRRLSGGDVRAAIRAGVSYVPDDRRSTGMAGGLSVESNLVLKSYRRPPMSRGPFVRRRAVRANADELVAANDVRTPAVTTPVRLLSGGNIQKAMLAREFAAGPRVLVASSPTRGLDVGATEVVRRRLVEAAGAGVGVLLISEDLEEILALADRVVVLYEGRIVGEVDGADADRESVGVLMGGGR